MYIYQITILYTLGLYNAIMVIIWASLVVQWLKKNLPANTRGAGSTPGSGGSSGEGKASTPVFLPGESHGQRSLES